MDKLNGVTGIDVDLNNVNDKQVVDELNLLAAKQLEDDFALAAETAAKALAAARSAGYLKGEADALLHTGLSYSGLREYQQALAKYQQALSVYQSLDDEKGISTVYSKIGNVYLHEGQYREALDLYDRALSIKTALKDTLGIADLHTNSAIIYGLLGHHVLALRLHLEALEIFELLNERSRIASSASNIGLIYWEQQNYDEALKMFNRALEIRQSRNDLIGVSDLMNNIGNVYREQKKFDSALKIYKQALALREPTGNDVKIGYSYLYIGNIYKDLQQYKEAFQFSKQAYAILKHTNDKRGIVQVLIGLGDLHVRLNQFKEARENLEGAIKLSEELGLKSQQREALVYMTDLLEKEKDYEKAFYTNRQFMQLDKELVNAETSRQIAQISLQNLIEQKAKENEIERLRNVELREALEKLRLEKSRSEHLFQNQLQELKSSALQAQMNPHFVFNSLNAIQQYIWEKDPEEATAYLARFAKLIRSVLDNSRRQFVTLEQDLTALNYYIELESLRFENKLEYQLVCNSDINQSEIQLPPMLIQPFVENAIIHGLQPLKSNGSLIITIAKGGKDFLHITIEDNGIGRQKAGQLKTAENRTHQSVAMQLTKERLEKMNGGELLNSIIIHDLIDENGNATGTRVEMNVPVENTL